MLSYQVIARKWRPKNFSSLIGQDHISTTLLNALKSDRLAHALLFTGPRGTGKTSTARILAKSLRCPNAKDFVPCDKCDFCLEISAGSSVDVIEIDGASNNGVDAIRELRDTIHFIPTSGKWKVYIIDEVHMLTASAFNALLKTLEEPPAHVVFIMATTEVQKIPATILSRCQRFDFRRIPLKQVTEYLKKICDAEGINIEPSALYLIVRQTEGLLRDSQSLLDQVANYCNKKVSVDQVTEMLGLTDRSLLTETLRSVVNRDRDGLVAMVEKIQGSGVDTKVFAQDLLEEIRNLLVVKMANAGGLIDLPESEVESLTELGKNFSNEDIHTLFDMTLKGVNDLLRAHDPKLVLEMLLFRMVEAPKVQELKSLLAGKVTAPAPVTLPKSITNTSINSSSEFDQDRWNSFVSKLQSLNALFAAKLANTYFVTLKNGKLIIGLPKQHEFLLSQLADAEFSKKVSNYLNTFTGKGYSVEFILDDKTAGLSLKAVEEKKQKEEAESTQKLIDANPLVQSVKKHLNAKIDSIKERS